MSARCLSGDGGRDINGKYPETEFGLAETYLRVYSQWGGAALEIEHFLKEISIVWFARKLNLWEHLPQDLHGPYYLSGAVGDLRQERLDSVYDNMSMLVSGVDHIASLMR